MDALLMNALLLVAGIVIFGYIGAILALLYAKEDYKKALVPGTIAWIIVIVIHLVFGLEVLIALLMALILGAVAKLVLPEIK